MIRVANDRIAVEGSMTLPGATALLNEGKALLAQGVTVVDLAGVTEVDSSGISVVFGWLRAARDAGKSIRITNVPANFISLAEVYGVTEQLPLG
ncbi:MAG: STAS domain-containing protein [Gammaproteobacteria bacterium]|nr:STAS domain-containing protein [Gammaproteobacteria bacterium]MBU1646995.1 STAS domain-containing protein [Gammaproteobacteria bacterium]MBU1972507.1 STAS domain-containing protein [Gammaproteobacteria bacterium]